MQKSFFFLSPVEVVKVTSSNLEEVAEWCGGKVAETESRRVAGRMDKYVWVPTPKGTSISWAFPGMYITKRLVRTVKDDIRVTFAVFRKDYFDKNYFDSPNQAVDETWERHFKAEEKAKKVAPKPTAPRNHLEGTSLEEYVPDEGESVKGHPAVEDVQLDEAVELTGVDMEGETHVDLGPVKTATETDHEVGPVQDVDFRSAETGQYVTEEFAEANPATTVAEVDEVAEVAEAAIETEENILKGD